MRPAGRVELFPSLLCSYSEQIVLLIIYVGSMDIFLRNLACLAIGALSVLSASSQRSPARADVDTVRTVVLLLSEDKNRETEIISLFEETQRPRFHDPRPPRLLLAGREGKFALGIGGYLKTTLEYDFDGIVDDVDFIPALIPQPGTPTVNNRFQMDATTSTLFVKLAGRTRRLGNYVVYTSGNFRGSGKTFELQAACLSLLGFTVGYDMGLFMDPSACPPTIDFQGPNGMTFYRTTQLRYDFRLPWGLSAGIGVEMPSVDGSPSSDVQIGSQRAPDVPVFVSYAWKPGSHVRLGAIFRSMTYEDEADNNRFRSLTGWGVQASATAGLCNFRLFGQFTYGKGIANYLNDLSNLDVDIVPLPDKPGRMQVLPMNGWYAGLQYNFSKRLFASATYSASRLFSSDGYASSDEEQYKKGCYFVMNLFWNANHSLQLAMEYLHGRRENFNGADRSANRVNLSARYNF